jgi:hypothetical protein
MPKKPYPKFESEKAEIDWLAEVGRGVDDYMTPAPGPENDLGFTPPTEMPRKPITIRLPLEDLARAKALARELGMPYQTLLGKVIHEGLAAQQAALRQGEPAKGAPAIPSMPGLVEVMANQERMRAELGRITRALKKAKILI